MDSKPTSANNKPTSLDDKPPGQPIGEAARLRSKSKGPGAKQRRNKYVSPLFDDRGFPYPQDEVESMLPEVKVGRLIRKPRHDPQDCVMLTPIFGRSVMKPNIVKCYAMI